MAERPRVARMRDRVARRVKSDDTTVYNADEDYGESQHVCSSVYVIYLRFVSLVCAIEWRDE